MCIKRVGLIGLICFACLFLVLGLDRSQFDNKTVSYEDHIRHEHNMWHYLYFIVLVRVKDPTEFTGPESYVSSMIKVNQLIEREESIDFEPLTGSAQRFSDILSIFLSKMMNGGVS